jgi:hypothetical protein
MTFGLGSNRNMIIAGITRQRISSANKSKIVICLNLYQLSLLVNVKRSSIIAILVIATLSVNLSCMDQRNAQGLSYASVVDFDLDKQIYRPGDQVIVTINSPITDGAYLVLDVIEGNSDRRVFHASQTMDVPKDKEVIANYGRDAGPSPSSIVIKFTLPNALGVDYYQMKTAVYLLKDVQTNYVPAYTGSALIFTNEDAQKVFVTDVQVDADKDYRPGQGIPVSFQVKDGLGKNVKISRPTITLCNESKSFCPSANVESPSDVYSLNFGIPRLAPTGAYHMTISSGVYLSASPYAFTSESIIIRDIDVTGSPVTSEPMEIAQYFDYNERGGDIPQEFIGDGRVTYGQELVLGSSQDRLFTYGDEQVEVPLENVKVDFQIIDPDGEMVFNETRVVDQNGRISDVVFPINGDLKRGTYEFYHRPSKNGVDFHSGIERWAFHVTGMQKLNLTLPSEFSGGNNITQTIYFDSRDLDVTDYSYDAANKTLSLQVKNNHLYKHEHYNPLHNENGIAYISIPKHLLAEPFEVELDGKVVDFTLLEKRYYFSTGFNGTTVNPFLSGWEPENVSASSHTLVAVGPVYGDTGNLSINLLGAGNTGTSHSESKNVVRLEQVGFLDGSYLGVNETQAGFYTYVSAYVRNQFDIDIPFVAIAEVRNSDSGVTEFLSTINGTVNAYSPSSGDGYTSISVPWQPAQTGQYQMRLFLVSDLDMPYLLTNVSSAEVKVYPAPEPESPPVPDVATTTEIGESKEISIMSHERNKLGEPVKEIITLNNVATHTGDVEYLAHKKGFITIFLNYSVENIHNYAFYAEPEIEVIVDGDYYPAQLSGGALGSVLLPNEKRDSFVAVQAIEGATEATFDIKDRYTRETVWKLTVPLIK